MESNVGKLLEHYAERMFGDASFEDFFVYKPNFSVPPDHPLYGVPCKKDINFPDVGNLSNIGDNFKLPLDVPMNLSEVEMMKYYDVSKSKPTTLPWLPIETKSIHSPNNNGIFSIINQNNYHKGLWDMIEYSMPLYLSNKFHIVNVQKLMENSTTSNYIPLATYYSLFNETIGISYLRIINDYHNMYINMSKLKNSDKKSEEWENNVNKIIKCMKNILIGNSITTPSDHDYCKNPMDFLLEPCIIIQLPWKPMIFHQWLVASFNEVLNFELESLEFKYWCTKNEKITKVAEDILNLIKNLKERLLLGFAIINQYVSNFPEFDTKLPEVIFDTVVLPSIPILKFLLEKKALNIIKKLRILAWSNSKVIDDNIVHINPNIYLIDDKLSTFQIQNFNNHFIWNTEKPEIIFPIVENLYDAVKRIKNNCDELTTQNKEYDHFYSENIIQNQTSSLYTLNVTDKIALMLKTIKEHVIETRKLETITIDDVDFELKKCNINKYIQRMDSLDHNENLDQIVKHILIFHESCKLLAKSEKQLGAIAQIIKSQLKIIKHSALVQLVQNCCLQFEKFPIYKKQECLSEININEFINQIQNVKIDIEKQNRKLLFSKLPNEWQKNVNKNKITPPDIFDKKIDIVTSFENRIGRIIYNMTINSFDMNKRGYQVFPDWSTVQYILPCVVASYFEECKLQPINAEMLNLVNAIITFYENRYYITLDNPQEREKIILPHNEVQETIARLDNHIIKNEWCSVNLKIREHARRSIGYNTMHVRYETTITGIDQILNYMHDWPCHGALVEKDPNMPTKSQVMKALQEKSSFDHYYKDFANILNHWNEIIFYFTEYMYHIAIDLYEIPKPGIEISTCKQLSDLYFTSAVLSELELIFDMSQTNHARNNNIRQQMYSVTDSMKHHRYEILNAVVNSSKTLSKKELINFVENKKVIEIELYVQLKKYRKMTGKIKFRLKDFLPLSNINPDVKLAAQFYIDGNFTELEKMLTLFACVKKVVMNIQEPRACLQCGKLDTKRKLFPCEQCIKDQYPMINYYCGRRCQEIRWKDEHMAEHLEFDLGLLDLNVIKRK